MRFYLALILVALWTTAVGSIEPPEYKYPYPDPYLATATLAILSDDGATSAAQSSIVRVPGLRGRNNLPSLQGRGDVSLALYRQNDPAPLIFILPGLGSSPYFGIAPYLANMFHREGSHVVVLPSPLSWNFALSASRSGAPGYVPDDARDLYEVIQKSLKVLRDQHNVRTTAINFMGVSLGALEGAHLSVIDAAEGKVGIARYLLVNPPVDLAYAVNKIDEWKAFDRKFGKEKCLQIISNAIAIIDSFAKAKRDDPAVFEELAKKFAPFKREEMQYLFAENLQGQLAEMIYVTQVINDQRVLTSPRNDKRKRLEEAKSFTFTDYERKIALPVWRKQKGDLAADPQALLRGGSLASLYERLRGNPKVQITHNADDFFADKSSIEALKEALGDQVTVYPRGGHLGNLWYPENKEYVLNYFQARRPK